MLPLSWMPKVRERLSRVGPQNDGGYVIPDICLSETTHLLSFGLNNDWRFEKDFQFRSSCKIECYDHSVGLLFWITKTFNAMIKVFLLRGHFKSVFQYFSYKLFFDGHRAKHYLQKIGYDNDGAISLRSILATGHHNSVFLKIDIEGWEYRIIDEIASNAAKINGFAIEFHDVDLHKDRISYFINSLQQKFCLVHVHANNNGGSAPDGTPMVLEMTFVRERGEMEALPSDYTLPIPGLDFPNSKAKSDIKLKFS